MQANRNGRFFRLVEVIAPHRLAHAGPQLVPSSTLGHDAFGQTFGAITAVRLLGDFKDKLVHVESIRHGLTFGKLRHSRGSSLMVAHVTSGKKGQEGEKGTSMF